MNNKDDYKKKLLDIELDFTIENFFHEILLSYS